LVVGERLEDRAVGELADLLRPGDVVVFNDTRVIPARLEGRRGHARVEVTLGRQREGRGWSALARPARRLKPGDEIAFGGGFCATVTGKRPDGEVRLRFNRSGQALQAAIRRHGEVPLPPYIRALRAVEGRDALDYQSVFAAKDGAVAAPTASLHFTEALIERLHEAGIQTAFVTLHVGPGTFLPVRVDDTDDHRMQPEWGEIGQSAAQTIEAVRTGGGRVVAVGSTSLRLLETVALGQGRVAPFSGETRLFVTPGYRFQVVDVLLTNFHLPRSTLFVLVCAFAGMARMREAYAHAKRSGYRFYSYGDACLLTRQQR
jgi:S-adenosylmethionine:tRNA ribosyltransferase-isomerase